MDYRATVWVNGEKVAEHTGGYNAFTADVTDALKSRGKQEIVVAVTDTGGADQPMGKQSTNPGGIFYTQSSGIWQTVWMEPVADTSIDNVVTTPDIDTGTLAVTVESEGASRHARVEAVARDARGKVVGRVSGPANSELDLRVAGQHLWSPDDPYLYDLDIKLKDGRSTDKVGSYFACARWASRRSAATGSWSSTASRSSPSPPSTRASGPTASTTAPSDDALAFDLKAHKKLGFNAVRKHIKVGVAPLVPPRGQARSAGLAGLRLREPHQRDRTEGLRRPGPRDDAPAPQRALRHRLDRLQRGLGRVEPRGERPYRRVGEGRRPVPDRQRPQRCQLLQLQGRLGQGRHHRPPRLQQRRPALPGPPGGHGR
ncbi:hypothetical protein GCM10023238_22760 [Streptomyces heliomycini]